MNFPKILFSPVIVREVGVGFNPVLAIIQRIFERA